MTDELTKTFFDTFGIKARYYYKCKIQDTLVPEDEFILSYCSQSEVIGFCTDKKYYNSCRVIKIYKEYPTITDRILLGIIAKIMWSYSCTQNDFDAYEVSTVDNLKEAVLKHAIELSKNDDYVYCGVRTLFEEG